MQGISQPFYHLSALKNYYVADSLLYSGSSSSLSFRFCCPLFDREMTKVMTLLSLLEDVELR